MRNKIKISILCGGFSNEREISLKSGQSVAAALNPEKYDITILELGDDCEWHKNNKAFIEQTPDLAFIALHGKYGEDGTIQSILDDLNIPYTGSSAQASRLAMDKKATIKVAQSIGLHVPKSIVLEKDHENLSDDISFPCVIKPNESGSSIGVSIVETKEQLNSALEIAFKEDEKVLVEQYIKGREFTCGVLGNSNDGELMVLPVVEIITHDEEFFDYEAKYNSKTVGEICPAQIDKEVSEKIQELSKKIHMHLGCDGLTRSDFIISEDGQIYFLEINTIPGMTQVSLVPKEAAAAGMSLGEFFEKQIELALNKRI
jgi:D-alanine-D-alanine ligase